MSRTVAGVEIPDSAMIRAATGLIGKIESKWMLHHALRCYLFGALTGYRENLIFDIELLYVGALFHNVGLNARYRTSPYRFEVDGANAARDFLSQHAIAEHEIEAVWLGIALHTTPGVPEHLSALVGLIGAGVQMDVRGARYDEFTAQQRDEIVRTYPRESGFKEKLLEAYALGMAQRPETTFGSVNADVLDRWDPDYRRLNFCGLVLGSNWAN